MDAPTQPELPVGLVVVPGVLEIVTGESRQIGITVATTATITIMSDSTGIASVAESAERFELEVQEGVSNSTQINVSGGNVGITTVTITAEADGYVMATTQVRVEVIESLRIVATPPSVDLVADGASARIDVSVSRLIGGSVTVDIAATDGLRVPSSVTLTNLEAVAVEVSALAGASGTATLTFTATDYATATVTVEIMDAPTQPEPAVGLVVVPGVLEIVTGESRQIGITVATTATITIMSDSTGIASVAESAERFELEVQEGVSNSTQINVSGGNVGITTVTITAEADGYTSATASVRVEVVESLRIVATPPSVDLVADGASARIDVSVSRLIGGSVTVDIAATDGLRVPSSVTLTNLEAVAVEVSALAGASGTATLTFTADDYATARVTVEIEAAPTQPELPVGLVVVPGVLEIVTGESRQISITVETTATITIAGDGESARVAGPAEFTLLDGAENSTQIDVFGDQSGITTVTITAEADGYTSATASVRVEVVESLRIVARPPSVDLVADGASARINVSVSRLTGGSVTVNIAATDGLRVPSSVTLTNLEAVAVEVSALAGASGTATLTFTATDYATATVTVEIMDAPTQPELPVGLVVVPGVLEIVTGESRQIGRITVATTATITIMSR